MQEALQAISGLSTPLQLITVIVLCIVFWEPIAYKLFGYRQKDEKGVQAVSAPNFTGVVDSLQRIFEEKFTVLEGNHMAHLQAAIDNVSRVQRDHAIIITKIAETQRDTLEIIKDIKEYGVPCRKTTVQ